ncbi:tetratricopeptide repeat protein [Brumimicrobium salinarum]|uniref:tetratricopeptide repeat protein n=1 Tax=Brumimicrobium salinarum TaxID=2058658 RepID=UPI0013FE2918|nr:tetratricopeptide repeat protein [Brumimicrobium salinarum]
MIRIAIILPFIMLSSLLFSQDWKEELRLGKKFYVQGDYEAAYQKFLNAQKLAPVEIDLSQDIGNAAYRNKNYEMAEKAFSAAAESTEDVELQTKQVYNIGNSQMQNKDYASAIESYKDVLRKNPNDKAARYNLAQAQRKLKQEKKQQEKNQDKSSNDNQDQPSDQQNKNQEGNQNDKEHQDQNQSKNDQTQSDNSGGQDQNNSGGNHEAKLTERKTERMLEDLLRQEIKTKKKIRGVESNKENQNRSDKKW